MEEKEILAEMIMYIEDKEETIDCEWGSGRTTKELIKDNCMPELYFKIKNILGEKNEKDN